MAIAMSVPPASNTFSSVFGSMAASAMNRSAGSWMLLSLLYLRSTNFICATPEPAAASGRCDLDSLICNVQHAE